MQPRHLSPPVALKQLVTPWHAQFSNSSSSGGGTGTDTGSGSGSGVLSATICCGSTLEPSFLSLSLSSSTSLGSLQIGRFSSLPAAPVAAAVAFDQVDDVSTFSSFLPSSLLPSKTCLFLPKSSSAPPSTAPFAAVRFAADFTFCTSAACTSAASHAHWDAMFLTTSSSTSSSQYRSPSTPPSHFDGHTVMGCEGNGLGGCSVAVRIPPSVIMPCHYYALCHY
jgi:hypothetical protein